MGRPCWPYLAQPCPLWAGAGLELVYGVMPSAALPPHEIPGMNCVLLWARPAWEAALSANEDTVLRLVSEHSGRDLERGTVSARLPARQRAARKVQFLEMASEARPGRPK